MSLVSLTAEDVRDIMQISAARAVEIDRLRCALEPFARAAGSFVGDDPEGVFKISTLRVRHLRAAAAAFQPV